MTQELHRYLVSAVEPMSTKFVNDKILLDLLQGFEVSVSVS